MGIRDSFPGVKEPEHASRHVMPSMNMCIHDVMHRKMGNFNVTCKKKSLNIFVRKALLIEWEIL
jgi:hypothetical protein